jgi:cytochrome P450
VLMALMDKYPNDDLLLVNVFQDQLLLCKPELLADILVHRSYDFIKPTKPRKFLRQVLGDGLVTVEGDSHKFLRKNMLPAFGFRHIKNLYPMMWKKAVVLTERLCAEARDSHRSDCRFPDAVDLGSWTSKVTLDIIGVAGLGREFNTMLNSEDPLLQIYEKLFEPSVSSQAYFLLCSMLGPDNVNRLPWKFAASNQKQVHDIRVICRQLLQHKRAAIAKLGDDQLDVLSILIKSNNFSDDVLTDQLLTILAAG